MNNKMKDPTSLSKEQTLQMSKEAMKTAPTPEIKRILEEQCCELEKELNKTETNSLDKQDNDDSRLENK